MGGQVVRAQIPELPGCMAHGETQEVALEQIHEAINLWIETAREYNDPIPEPKGRRLSYACLPCAREERSEG